MSLYLAFLTAANGGDLKPGTKIAVPGTRTPAQGVANDEEGEPSAFALLLSATETNVQNPLDAGVLTPQGPASAATPVAAQNLFALLGNTAQTSTPPNLQLPSGPPGEPDASVPANLDAKGGIFAQGAATPTTPAIPATPAISAKPAHAGLDLTGVISAAVAATPAIPARPAFAGPDTQGASSPVLGGTPDKASGSVPASHNANVAASFALTETNAKPAPAGVPATTLMLNAARSLGNGAPAELENVQGKTAVAETTDTTQTARTTTNTQTTPSSLPNHSPNSPPSTNLGLAGALSAAEHALRLRGSADATLREPQTSTNALKGTAKAAVVTAAGDATPKSAATIQAAIDPNTIRALLGAEEHGFKPKLTEARFAASSDTAQELRAPTIEAAQAQHIKSLPSQAISEVKSVNLAHNTPRLDQVSLTNFANAVAQRLQGGNTRFEIRLDPAELGKVQIKLEVSPDNRVEAVVSTPRQDVLADLQKNADSLRRALIEAGFDSGSDGLSFSLDQGSTDTSSEQNLASDSTANTPPGTDEETAPPPAPFAETDRGFGISRIFAGNFDVRV